MSDKAMTLKERFDDHVEQANSYLSGSEEENIHGGWKGDAIAFATYAQLHATLALAVAQRMTAENTEYLEGVVDQLHDLVELKYQNK